MTAPAGNLRAEAREQIAREVADRLPAYISGAAGDIADAVLATPAVTEAFERAAKYDEIETGIEAELGQLRETVRQIIVLVTGQRGVVIDGIHDVLHRNGLKHREATQ